MLNENGIYSYHDLTQKIEEMKAKIHKNNAEVIKTENKYGTILDKADKAQEFIRLFKTHQYCEFYKSMDKNYEVPAEETIFLKLRDELKIETVEDTTAGRTVTYSITEIISLYRQQAYQAGGKIRV